MSAWTDLKVCTVYADYAMNNILYQNTTPILLSLWISEKSLNTFNWKAIFLGHAVFADNVFNELLSNLSGMKRQPGNLLHKGSAKLQCM